MELENLINVFTLCVRRKAVVRLHICASSTKPSTMSYFICARKGCGKTANLRKLLLTFTNVLTLCVRGKAMVSLHICAISTKPSTMSYIICARKGNGETAHLHKLLLTFNNVLTLCVRGKAMVSLHICAISTKPSTMSYIICARKGNGETAHLHKLLLTFNNVLTLCV